MSNSGKRRIYVQDPRPRKRFRTNNHNHNGNRNFVDEVSLYSHSDIDIEPEVPSHAVPYERPKAMSQAVYHDREEVEMEFVQCLNLYGFAPRKRRTSRKSSSVSAIPEISTLSHTMSQVVCGRYGNRSNVGRNNRNRRKPIRRPSLIRKSQNNPWDRKLIEYMKMIPSIMMIEHYRNDDSDCSEEEPSSNDWIDASLAINCCVELYGHRVDNLRDKVRKLQSAVTCTEIDQSQTGNSGNTDTETNDHHSHRRSTTKTTVDQVKIMRDPDGFRDIESLYTINSMHAIRQQSGSLGLFMGSTWWSIPAQV